MPTFGRIDAAQGMISTELDAWARPNHLSAHRVISGTNRSFCTFAKISLCTLLTRRLLFRGASCARGHLDVEWNLPSSGCLVSQAGDQGVRDRGLPRRSSQRKGLSGMYLKDTCIVLTTSKKGCAVCVAELLVSSELQRTHSIISHVHQRQAVWFARLGGALETIRSLVSEWGQGQHHDTGT